MAKKFYGNTRAKQTLTAAIHGGRLCHAYLIEGEDGVGKTGFALWFASAILCTGTGDKPCGICSACYKTERLIHPDLHLYLSDSKKNSFHVKMVRDIKESVYTRPNDGDYKVYILCRAEDMTAEAQNALLKMLEEPPEDTVFFITCRNRMKIPSTVISRCVPIALSSVTEEECQTALIENGIAQPIAKELAERFHGNIGLALDAATDAAYQAEADRQQAVLTAMVSGNEYALIKALSAYEGKKQEIYNLLDCLSETVRDAVILKSGENDLISSFPAEAEKLTHCITVSQGVQLNELFSQIKKQLDFNGNIPLTLLALGGKIKDITEK